MRASLLGSVLSALVLAACSDASSSEPAPPAQPAPETPPPVEATATTLKTVACRFIVPTSVEGKTVKCADVSVPENRRTPGSKEITLHVAIVAGKPGGVPTIELNGGPGGGADQIVGGLVAREAKLLEAYGKMLEQGDIVFFDQRGTGRSIPRLSCGEDASGCQKTLAGKADLTAYDTQENADDVAAIAKALGAAKVNLHGISYGTRLGIEVVKRHPDLVRAMIIDGVMPPDVTLLGGFQVAIDTILTRVFQACAADAKCNTTYPDLEGTLKAVAKKLTETPLQVTHPYYGPMTYDWDMFLEETMQRLYVENEAGALPRRLHEMLTIDAATYQKQLDDEENALESGGMMEDPNDPLQAELARRLEAMTEEDMEASGMSQGMYMSVTCNDYLQHESVEAGKAALAKVRPELVTGHDMDEAEECKTWPVRPSDPLTRQPATWSGPALVIGGLLDPATPSAWAEHGLKGGFLANPSAKIDATCATSRAITFSYPTQKWSKTSGAFLPLTTTMLPPARTLSARIEQRVLAQIAATSRGSMLTQARAKRAALRGVVR